MDPSREGMSQKCAVCGKPLPLGHLKYIVSIKMFADFDGVLQQPDEEPEEGLDQLIAQIEKMSPEECERDVYEERLFILCKRCKDQFSQNPLGKRENDKSLKGDTSGVLH